jgi:hypothetical protein
MMHGTTNIKFFSHDSCNDKSRSDEDSTSWHYKQHQSKSGEHSLDVVTKSC